MYTMLAQETLYLKKAWVITVEPGIYIADEAIGIRIEDDVLVTAESNRVLSDFYP